MPRRLSHVDKKGKPRMVDVSGKKATRRFARARGWVRLGKEILSAIKRDELVTRKGPVFQTAIVAGVAGAKRTAELIPFCHPLPIENCSIDIRVKGKYAIIDSEVRVTARTGVEMEALAAVTIAALTIYDMCKALSHDIRIEEVKLMEKKGGKRNFSRS